MTQEAVENLTDTAVKALKTVLKAKKSTTAEKISAAGKLAAIEHRSDKAGSQSGLDRMDRAQIEAELRRCQTLLDTNDL